MSDIKISVKDFRAIHSADINLNGITVIAGVNGSGKSTLSRLLYTIFNKVKTLDDVYWSAFYSETFAIREVCQQIYDTLKPETLDHLSFYRAVPSDADAYTYDYQNMGTDIEPIFESFNKSYELIEKYGTDNG